ncbi:hypothetical protein M3O57_12980 [Xanthomonas nasturtii]|nr:hypothetical protein [Xanthomonas nasturtii]MCL1531104.1 hypothetical protein [Xanthomonas nasturtii]MCL1551592.1 hypothetical protein [Xanthomonas nasturtii]MCL1555903.1 hypothetical protein [Xanthomonas nasturtii]MCL1565899.1 hypothetical protein [Xanthomonas nasturtii]MCL1569992.1 hypothetical protein [Xanthomonas nasturtii]
MRTAVAAPYARAHMYARCAALTEAAHSTAGSVGAADATARDATEGSLQRAPDHAAQLMACRHIGQGDYAQVEQPLRQAAVGGDPDAQLELLRQRARRFIEQQPDLGADGRPQPLSFPGRAEAEQALANLEERAMHGDRAAMPVLDQLLSSPLLDIAEPLYGDAGRLVFQQPFGRPLQPATPLRGEEMFDDMDAVTQQQVVLLARELHAKVLRSLRCLPPCK